MVELAPAGTRLGASDGGLPLSDCESVSKPRACCLLFHRDRRETYYSWRLFIPLPIPTTVIVTAVHIIADGGRISNARQSLRASNVAVRCRLLFRVERDRTLDWWPLMWLYGPEVQSNVCCCWTAAEASPKWHTISMVCAFKCWHSCGRSSSSETERGTGETLERSG